MIDDFKVGDKVERKYPGPDNWPISIGTIVSLDVRYAYVQWHSRRKPSRIQRIALKHAPKGDGTQISNQIDTAPAADS